MLNTIIGSIYRLLLAVVLLVPVSLHAKSVTFSGTLSNTGNTQYLFLWRCFATEMYKIDSAKIVGGKFHFHFAQGLKRGFYRITIDQSHQLMVILGQEEHVRLIADIKNPESIKYSGSVENAVFRQFHLEKLKFQQEFRNLETSRQQLAYQQYPRDEYEKQFALLNQKLDSLNNAQYLSYEKIIAMNPGTLMAKVIAMFQGIDKVAEVNFFKPEEYIDPEYAYGDMLSSKLLSYFQRFSPNMPSWRPTVNTLLSRFAAQSENKEALEICLIRLFVQYDPELAHDIFQLLVSEFPKSRFIGNLKKDLPPSSPRVGSEAPDIALKDLNGSELKLSSLKGKVVLLDFWASWCGPCRAENPNVVKAYEKFKDKGFTVYSVSLDDNDAKWRSAIQADSLSWPYHVSDLKGWKSEAAALYAVRGIPAQFLIDREGKIIGTNLRGPALEQKLTELFP